MRLTRAMSAVVAMLATAVVASANADPLAIVCDARTVSDAIASRQPLAQKECYDTVHGKTVIPADVQITAHVSYEKDGAVSAVSTTASTTTSAARALEPCVAANVRAWVLPCGPNKVDVAFNFPSDSSGSRR